MYKMIQFTVTGNPIPYTRTTQRGKFVSPQWKRYADYKTKIVAAFLNAIDNDADKRKFVYNYQMYGKPIITTEKGYVLSVAYFANKRHGDMDNINKGVLDALFVSDKNIVGAYNFDYDSDYPRLEIVICFDANEWKSILRKVNWNEKD